MTEKKTNSKRKRKKKKKDIKKNNEEKKTAHDKQLEREIKHNNNRIDNNTIILTYKINLKHQIKRKNNNKYNKIWLKFLIQMRKYLKIGKKIVNRLLAIHPDNRIYNSSKDITNSKIFKNIKNIKELNTNIMNQIIRKYGGNKKLKKVTNMILPIHTNTQKRKRKNGENVEYKSIVYDNEITKEHPHPTLTIKPLNLTLRWKCPNPDLIKINQVEINDKFCYVCITAKKKEDNTKYNNIIGYDFNLKPTLVCSSKGKFMGAKIVDERKKYIAMRTRWQKQKKLWKVKEMGNKEHRVMNDKNHKLSNAMLLHAKENNAHISVENLTGIRSQKLKGPYKYFINSWQFYALRMHLVYKAEYKYGKMQVVAINPAYTSQECSKCGSIHKTNTKFYHCKTCNFKGDRDINAAINIAKRGIERIEKIKIEEHKYKLQKIEKKHSSVKEETIKKHKIRYQRKKKKT
jgi:putative transposase